MAHDGADARSRVFLKRELGLSCRQQRYIIAQFEITITLAT